MTTDIHSRNDMAVFALKALAALCLLASLVGIAVLVPDRAPGRLRLTAEGCASVRLAGGHPQQWDGVCVVGGLYRRYLSGWTTLSLPSDQEVTLSSRAVIMEVDDDSAETAESFAERRRGLMVIGGCLVAAALCVGLAIRVSRRGQQNRESESVCDIS